MSKQFHLVTVYVDHDDVEVTTWLGAYDLLGILGQLHAVGAEITHASPGRVEANNRHVFYRAVES